MLNEKIAEELLRIEAVFLKPNDPFTWSSGIQSPIYCDNRLTMSYPEVRREIASGLKSLIEEHFPETAIIAGTATAGIAHAAWVSDLMNLPMCYVRSKPKGHGKGNQIEGKTTPGAKVVVIEDLISTGGSVISSVQALRDEGCEVLGVVSIFTYELASGIKQLAEAGIQSYSLSDYSTLVKVASQNGYIQTEDLKKLNEWRQNPSDSSWVNA